MELPKQLRFKIVIQGEQSKNNRAIVTVKRMLEAQGARFVGFGEAGLLDEWLMQDDPEVTEVCEVLFEYSGEIK